MNIKELLHKALSIVLPLGMMMGSLCFTSCEETAEVDEYANWQARNTEYIDSIAAIAEANTDGKWKKILSFKLNETSIDSTATEWDNSCYIYCHIESEGTGTKSPVFSDTVLVNYRGSLIPTTSYPQGKVFDQSYLGELNHETNKPKKFSCGGIIVGWSTALQQMKKGDVWKVYIPAKLGYGSSSQSNIPAHSTLIFTINLVDFYK